MRNRKGIGAKLVVLGILCALLTACGQAGYTPEDSYGAEPVESDTAGSLPGTPTPIPTPVTPAGTKLRIPPPAGTYRVWVPSTDTKLYGVDKADWGNWTLTFLDQSNFFITHDYSEVIRGTYVLASLQISFFDRSGSRACIFTTSKDLPSRIYKWAFDGKELILTVLQEYCAEKSLPFILHPLLIDNPVSN